MIIDMALINVWNFLETILFKADIIQVVDYLHNNSLDM